jgi:hypothetical protein
MKKYKCDNCEKIIDVPNLYIGELPCKCGNELKEITIEKGNKEHGQYPNFYGSWESKKN